MYWTDGRKQAKTTEGNSVHHSCLLSENTAFSPTNLTSHKFLPSIWVLPLSIHSVHHNMCVLTFVHLITLALFVCMFVSSGWLWERTTYHGTRKSSKRSWWLVQGASEPSTSASTDSVSVGCREIGGSEWNGFSFFSCRRLCVCSEEISQTCGWICRWVSIFYTAPSPISSLLPSLSLSLSLSSLAQGVSAPWSVRPRGTWLSFSSGSLLLCLGRGQPHDHPEWVL